MTQETHVPNDQQLPPGIPPVSQYQAQPQQQYVPQGQPEYTHHIPPVNQPPEQPGQHVDPNSQHLPPAPQHGNPMLSRFSQPVPQPPTQHLEQQPGQQVQQPAPQQPAPQNYASAADLVGDLANDAYVKPALTYLENVCTQAEVDISRAFGKAVEYGDSGLIDTAYLTEKLGENARAVIEQATALFDYSSSKATETLNTVFQSVGGEQVLRQAAQHFNQSASAEERAEIAYLLDSGNVALMQRAAQRIVQYGRQGGAVYQPTGHPVGSPTAARGLSKEEYIKAISNPRLTPQEYEQLRQQRVLGKNQGIN